MIEGIQTFCRGCTWHVCFFFFSSRRRHTRLQGDWSSDVCSSDLRGDGEAYAAAGWGANACRRQGRATYRAGARLLPPTEAGLKVLAEPNRLAILSLDRKSVV